MQSWLVRGRFETDSGPDRNLFDRHGAGRPTSTDAFSTRRTFMTRLIALLVLAGTAMLASGCNTVAGAGEDISKGGNAITNSAEQNK